MKAKLFSLWATLLCFCCLCFPALAQEPTVIGGEEIRFLEDGKTILHGGDSYTYSMSETGLVIMYPDRVTYRVVYDADGTGQTTWEAPLNQTALPARQRGYIDEDTLEKLIYEHNPKERADAGGVSLFVVALLAVLGIANVAAPQGVWYVTYGFLRRMFFTCSISSSVCWLGWLCGAVRAFC